MLLILSFRRADPLQYVRKRKKYTQRQLSFHRGQTGGFYRKKPGKWKIIYRFAQFLLTNAGNSAIVNFVRSTKECLTGFCLVWGCRTYSVTVLYVTKSCLLWGNGSSSFCHGHRTLALSSCCALRTQAPWPAEKLPIDIFPTGIV